jgi:hypothetical protein
MPALRNPGVEFRETEVDAREHKWILGELKTGSANPEKQSSKNSEDLLERQYAPDNVTSHSRRSNSERETSRHFYCKQEETSAKRVSAHLCVLCGTSPRPLRFKIFRNGRRKMNQKSDREL